MDAAVTMYHAYRFVITSENTIVPGYVTEKVAGLAKTRGLKRTIFMQRN